MNTMSATRDLYTFEAHGLIVIFMGVHCSLFMLMLYIYDVLML
jgi:hypothetical protein